MNKNGKATNKHLLSGLLVMALLFLAVPAFASSANDRLQDARDRAQETKDRYDENGGKDGNTITIPPGREGLSSNNSGNDLNETLDEILGSGGNSSGDTTITKETYVDANGVTRTRYTEGNAPPGMFDDFNSPGNSNLGGNTTVTGTPGSSNNNSLTNTRPPTVDVVTNYMDNTMRPLWEVGATAKAGTQGLGFMILSSLFGVDVFTEMMGTNQVEVNGQQVIIEGPTQGISIAMMSFAAQLAFLLLPILMGLLATTGLVNSLQFGEWFGSDQPSYYLAIRFLGGMVLAIPNPLFFGMSSIQQVIILLALYSNGMGNYAAEMLVTASYESAGGAKHVALAIGAIPPEPVINLSDVSGEIFLRHAIQQSCVENAKIMGIGGRERAETCRAMSGSIVDSAVGSGGLDNEGEDLNNVSAGQSQDLCGPPREGIASAYSRRISINYAVCMATNEAVTKVKPMLAAAARLEGDDAKQAAMIEAANFFKEQLGLIRGNTEEIIREYAQGGLTSACGSIAPDLKAACEASPDQFDFASQADPLTSARMIIKTAGWPGMGMLYYKVASEIEAMNTTARVVGSDTKLDLNSMNQLTRVNSALMKKVQNDTVRAAVAEAIVDETPSAHVAKDTNIFLRYMGWYNKKLTDTGQAAANAVVTGTEYANMNVSGFFAEFFTSGSAPEAMYNYSSIWIGVLAGTMIAADTAHFAGKVIESAPTPVGAIVKVKGYVKKLTGILNGKSSKTKDHRESSLTYQAMAWAFGFIVKFITLIAFINVAVLPKLPAVFVSIMAVDWAINILVIAFAAPLWMLFNMSAAPAGKMLFTHTVLKGIQTLAWVLLYPTLIVFGVAVSMIIFNISVPLIVTIVSATYQDGIISNVVNMLMAPFIFMFLATVMGFASISLILRLPYQFASFLGLSPMEGEMIKSASRYLGGDSHLGEAQRSMSMTGVNSAG